MTYKCTLKYPGTILHVKRGRIDLCLLSQAELKELHETGCAYIDLVPGNPPCEKPLEAKATPKRQPDKAGNSKKKYITPKPPPEPQPEESPE
jgi:hypothetical protein